ncbi:MAG: thioredoxin domain-containing protein [Gemmatimonadetes bacterium]|nr:thioredoxin domain-containing protein [Gemmatimonadota bacterium]
MPNRLIHEKSPYLLQHANNPVDWYPWGEEAFEAARELDRPIFLSIGYATCHWCHVMEHESFEDPEVARLMNEAFVNIKVDREERPDVDGIYMAVAQLTTGHGGWPLTILMTPDRVPFLAATYIPRDNRHGRVGMVNLVPRVGQAWREDRPALLSTASSIRQHLDSMEAADFGGRSLGAEVLRQGFGELSASFDREHGGFGSAPKFPTPHRLLFLLRYWKRTGVDMALAMVEQTLDSMRAGGVYDQVGFGFHRYSTDHEWLVPHFEKMLYDQAMLMLAFTESVEAKPGPEREAVVREIAEYVLRDLTSADGAFYSAEDADSEGEEGKFYVWSLDEVQAVLGDLGARAASETWGLEVSGNYRDEASGEPTGLNIAHRARPLAEVAGDLGLTEDETATIVAEARLSLFEHRGRRERPLLDDKVLTDWNGLMIAALARAGRALGDADLVAAAGRAATFIDSTMWRDGDLLHRYRDGEAALGANLDDFAFLAWGEIELYQATLEPEHLARAIRLTEAMIERFRDTARGGFYFSAAGREDLLVRQRQVYDGAIPSGNSVALYNLVRLARLTGRSDYEKLASETASAFSRQVASQPSSFTFFLSALDMEIGPSQELVIVGDPESAETAALLAVAGEGYHPARVVLLRPPGAGGRSIAELAPFTESFGLLDGHAAAYLCSGFACERPVSDPEALRDLIRDA